MHTINRSFTRFFSRSSGTRSEGVKEEEETARTTAAATAAAAAAARAARAEAALSEALEAMEELEARCAVAQAREAEAVREAGERVQELARRLEGANGLGGGAEVCVQVHHRRGWLGSAKISLKRPAAQHCCGSNSIDADLDRSSAPYNAHYVSTTN